MNIFDHTSANLKHYLYANYLTGFCLLALLFLLMRLPYCVFGRHVQLSSKNENGEIHVTTMQQVCFVLFSKDSFFEEQKMKFAYTALT
jgi:hypothetical protein